MEIFRITTTTRPISSNLSNGNFSIQEKQCMVKIKQHGRRYYEERIKWQLRCKCDCIFSYYPMDLQSDCGRWYIHCPECCSWCFHKDAIISPPHDFFIWCKKIMNFCCIVF